MKTALSKGFLIVIEGIDGSGKSSLAHSLYTYFNELYDCVLTREPGGSQIGSQLRSITQGQKVDPKAEYLLFAADRAQHFNEVIIPALQTKKMIISDRMADSSLAYQGYARGLDKEIITIINRWAMSGIEPDLIIYAKISVAEAKRRILQRNEALTTFEQEKESFMQKVADAYDDIFKDRNNVAIIDASLSQEQMVPKAIKVIEQCIKNR